MGDYEYIDYEELLKMLKNYSKSSENDSVRAEVTTQHLVDDLSEIEPSSNNSIDELNESGNQQQLDGSDDSNQIDGGQNQAQVEANQDKPFGCELCDRVFVKKCHLMCHMRAHLPPEEKEKLKRQRQEKMAGIRRRKLASERQLYSKRYEVEGDWVLCHICLKCFNNRDDHLIHAKWHQFVTDNPNPFSNPGVNQVPQKNQKNQQVAVAQSKDVVVEVARKKKKFPNLVPDSDKRSIQGKGQGQGRDKNKGQGRDIYVVDNEKPGCSKYLYYH